jgi:hypothetical protein
MRSFRSYILDLTEWLTHLARGYFVATALFVVGGTFIVSAFGFGVAAAVRIIQDHYGIYVAYASVGGAFLTSGMFCIVLGRVLSRRPKPAAPRFGKVIKGSIAGPAAFRLIGISRGQGGLRADPATQALAILAAATLIGWVAASNLRREGGIGRGPG